MKIYRRAWTFIVGMTTAVVIWIHGQPVRIITNDSKQFGPVWTNAATWRSNILQNGACWTNPAQISPELCKAVGGHCYKDDPPNTIMNSNPPLKPVV